MQVIVSGSRHIHEYVLLEQAVAEAGIIPSCIIHGDATGVDKLGARYADAHAIPQLKFPADWNKHGRAAGPIRNGEMVNFAKQSGPCILIAIWDGISKGTFDCIKKAHAAEIPVYVRCVIPLKAD